MDGATQATASPPKFTKKSEPFKVKSFIAQNFQVHILINFVGSSPNDPFLIHFGKGLWLCYQGFQVCVSRQCESWRLRNTPDGRQVWKARRGAERLSISSGNRDYFYQRPKSFLAWLNRTDWPIGMSWMRKSYAWFMLNAYANEISNTAYPLPLKVSELESYWSTYFTEG